MADVNVQTECVPPLTTPHFTGASLTPNPNGEVGLLTWPWIMFFRCVAKKVATGVVAGDPGTVNFTPTLAAYGMMSLKDFTLGGSGKADLVHVVVWYVDEPDTQYLYAILTDSLNSTDLTPSPGVTVFARAKEIAGVVPAFATGDLVLIDDSGQDPDATDFRKYELVTLGTITGTQPGAVTFALASRGNLGSTKSAHNAGTRLYKVKAAHFAVPTKDNTGNPKITGDESVPLANACVVAMGLAASDVGTIGTFNVKNCSRLAYPFPGTLTQRNPAPGFRTCTGAEYTIPLGGALIAGQSSPFRLVVSENASPRNVLGRVLVSPEGSIAFYDGILGGETDKGLIAYVLLIEPQQDGLPNGARRIAVLDQLAIIAGEFATFPQNDVLDFRRMPYRPAWPFLCPVIGTLDSLFDPALGALRTGVLPFTTTGEFLQMEEGGELDAVIARAGSDVAGSHLTVTVQT